jgi:hypothetical protein
VLGYQRSLLMHLLSPTVHKRMSDSRMYGNTYSVLAMMNDLTNAIFSGENGAVPTFRINLQNVYVDYLLQMVNAKNYDAVSQSAALVQLKNIQKMNLAGNTEVKANMDLIKHKIEEGLDNYDVK